MSRALLTFAILAAFCLSASFANQTGFVSVNITNKTLLGDVVTSVDQEFVEFSYDALEWGSDAANWNTEWGYLADGVGEFLLNDNSGDQILIDALNNDNNTFLDNVLDQVVGSPAGGNTTIASNIGNSIAHGHQSITSVNYTNNSAAAVVNNATAAPVAILVPAVAVVAAEQPNVTENVETVEAAETASEVEVSEYVPLSVVEGPAPIEAVISEESYPNGTVVTSVTKFYNGTANASESAEAEAVEVQPEAVEAAEAVEVQPEAAEAVEVQPEAAEAVEVQPEAVQAVEIQPEAAEAVEVQSEAAEAVEVQSEAAEVQAPVVEVEEVPIKVTVTEEANANGTITTSITKFFAQNATNTTQSENAENSEVAAAETQQQ